MLARVVVDAFFTDNGIAFPLMIQRESDTRLCVMRFPIVSFAASTSSIAVIVFRKRNTFINHEPKAIVVRCRIWVVQLRNGFLETPGDDGVPFSPGCLGVCIRYRHGFIAAGGG